MAEATNIKTPTRPADVTLTIDGQPVTVPKGTTVLEAAQGIGIHIPTFCWHPKLKSAGSCRMCYVEIEKMPKLAVSCATEVMDGMVVHTASEEVLAGRRAVLEFILLNHPLDCPTCDQGGECDLQNVTFEHGSDESRFDFQKRRFIPEEGETTFDDKPIGPDIIFNSNRCIRCYKCVRMNKEAFGEYDIGAFERGDISEIGPPPGGQVANPYSGNLIEYCPVGALTSKDWRYKIRVWRTRKTPSICPFTSSGTNTTLFTGQTKDRIFRVRSLRNDDIDDGWIPNVTRYGYQVIYSEDRLKTPLVKKEGTQVPASWDEAMALIGKRLGEISSKSGRVCIGGLADPSLDNATLYSFSKLIRVVLGSNNIDFRTEQRMLPAVSDDNFGILSSRPFRIADIDDSDVIVTFGTDLIKEHRNEYLRVRKAYNFHGASVMVLHSHSVKASDVAEQELVYKIGREEVVISAICLAAIEENLIVCSDAERLKEASGFAGAREAAEACGVDPAQIKAVARAIAEAGKVSFIVGEAINRSRGRESIAAALCNLNLLFGIESKGQIAVLPLQANYRGAEKLGLTPIPVPALKNALQSSWGEWPDAEPQNTDRMMVNIRKEEIDGLIVLGANPIMLYPDYQFALEALERLDFLVACDLFETKTTALADVVLPLSSWVEYPGDYVNCEDRIQTAAQAIKPMYESKPGFEIVEMIAGSLGKKLFESAGVRDEEIKRILSVETRLAWPDSFVKAIGSQDEAGDEFTIPLVVGDDPHHRGHYTEKANTLVAFSGEAYIELSPELAAEYSIEEGDSVRVESEVGKVIVPARISDHIENDVVFIPCNFSSTPVTSLLMRKRRVDVVKISKVVK